MYKNLLLLIFGGVCIAAVLTVLQIWFTMMEWDTFIKVIITLGIFVMLAAFGLIVTSDLSQNKEMKDKNYLD